MIDVQELLDYCMQMKGAQIATPFGPEPICVRVGAKLFAELYPSRAWATLRCEPERALEWRAMFPDAVRRGYYCPPDQQPYKNTITLDGTVPDELIRLMACESYARALKTMTRAERADI